MYIDYYIIIYNILTLTFEMWARNNFTGCKEFIE